MRLLDCLGLLPSSCLLWVAEVLIGDVDLGFASCGGGLEAGLRTGLDRKAEGDGMVMVSISRTCQEEGTSAEPGSGG